MSQTSNTKVFTVYIKAPAAEIWEAITSPDINVRYGYRAPMYFELRHGGRFEAHANEDMRAMGLPPVIVDGEVMASEAPYKLQHSYRFLFSPDTVAEGFTHLTWEIQETGAGFCRVSVTHDLGSAQGMAGAVSSNYSSSGGGGWTWILSDLKTLIETGKPMSE